jgi:hypothetical protein
VRPSLRNAQSKHSLLKPLHPAATLAPTPHPQPSPVTPLSPPRRPSTPHRLSNLPPSHPNLRPSPDLTPSHPRLRPYAGCLSQPHGQLHRGGLPLAPPGTQAVHRRTADARCRSPTHALPSTCFPHQPLCRQPAHYLLPSPSGPPRQPATSSLLRLFCPLTVPQSPAALLADLQSPPHYPPHSWPTCSRRHIFTPSAATCTAHTKHGDTAHTHATGGGKRTIHSNTHTPATSALSRAASGAPRWPVFSNPPSHPMGGEARGTAPPEARAHSRLYA